MLGMSETPHAEQSPAEQPQDPSGPSWSHGPWAPQSQIGPAEVPRVTWTPGTTGGDRLHDALDSDGSATPPVDAAPTDTPTGQPSLAERVERAKQQAVRSARGRVARATAHDSTIYDPLPDLVDEPAASSPTKDDAISETPQEGENYRKHSIRTLRNRAKDYIGHVFRSRTSTGEDIEITFIEDNLQEESPVKSLSSDLVREGTDDMFLTSNLASTSPITDTGAESIKATEDKPEVRSIAETLRHYTNDRVYESPTVPLGKNVREAIVSAQSEVFKKMVKQLAELSPPPATLLRITNDKEVIARSGPGSTMSLSEILGWKNTSDGSHFALAEELKGWVISGETVVSALGDGTKQHVTELFAVSADGRSWQKVYQVPNAAGVYVVIPTGKKQESKASNDLIYAASDRLMRSTGENATRYYAEIQANTHPLIQSLRDEIDRHT